MATRYDPFTELTSLLNSSLRQVPSSPVMPLDLYREGDTFVASLDLPGVDPGSIDIDMEDRTLTIRAERLHAGGPDRSVEIRQAILAENAELPEALREGWLASLEVELLDPDGLPRNERTGKISRTVDRRA